MSYKGSLSKIPKADIDSEGVFKYIQINCKDLVTNESLIAIRGYNNCEFHPDILDKFESNQFISFFF